MTLIILSILLSTARAIEFLPCQRELSGADFVTPAGDTVRLEPNQIVVRGPLGIFFEQGMEKLEFAVTDRDTERSLTRDLWTALHFLREGDRVFLLTSNGKLAAEGFHADRVEANPLRVRTIPSLYTSPARERRVMDDVSYDAFFHAPVNAVAILTLSHEDLRAVDARYAPLIEARRELANDPRRLISLGPDMSVAHERRLVQEIWRGQLRQRGERPKLVLEDARRLTLDGTEKRDDDVLIGHGDLIYVMGKTGNLMIKWVVNQMTDDGGLPISLSEWPNFLDDSTSTLVVRAK